MLEFIVSGQIPGTPLQLTFNWAMFFVAIGLGVYEIRRVMKRHNFTIQNSQINVLLHTKLPVKPVSRKKTVTKQLELF